MVKAVVSHLLGQPQGIAPTKLEVVRPPVDVGV